MFAQSNKSTATLLTFFKLSSNLFEKSGIAPELFRNFWGLLSLVRPRASRNLEVGTYIGHDLFDRPSEFANAEHID